MDYAQGDTHYRFGSDYKKLLQLAEVVGYDSVTEGMKEIYKNAGDNTMAVAEYFSMKIDRVRKILRRSGIVLSRGGKKSKFFRKANFHPDDAEYNFYYYDDLIDIAVTYGYDSVKSAYIGLYRTHGTAEHVSKIFGVTPRSVIRVLKKENIALYRGGRREEEKCSWPDENKRRRLHWTGQKLTQTMVANFFGASPPRIRKYAKLGMPYEHIRWNYHLYDPVECWDWMKLHGYAEGA